MTAVLRLSAIFAVGYAVGFGVIAAGGTPVQAFLGSLAATWTVGSIGRHIEETMQ